MFLTTELIHKLPVSERRVYSRDEAASYVGMSPGHFASLVAEGVLPPPLPLRGIKRWDKAALDHALDKLSRLPSSKSDPLSPYDAWRSARGQG